MQYNNNDHGDIISTFVGGAVLIFISFTAFVFIATWIFS
jgi:hypothetical protein